ncbi:YihY/virulence factor BrkB family protein [Bdellovibrio svalbardensis]|uniref:YihY/virulence factor BrkB family protein n=1 Tax=Bdellovibrio svalbardensis TaxID=2972972 RepID=A0ABT6DKF9_9BACT|nr:YihY/virulence factor BrkB family protein [Bdellovibrio svalbardensis]MDG0817029.1 YihY/virulence factor BrkB family protein [Bdellovibrio svalbardensis]
MDIKSSFKKISNKGFQKKLVQDDIMEMSASLSFYSALSLAPLLVLLLTIVAFINDSLRDSLLSQAQSWFGDEAGQLIREIAVNASQNSHARDRAGIFGFLTLLFSAGLIFGHLRTSLNKIFQIKNADNETEQKSVARHTFGFLKSKVFNMAMVLTFVLISIVSVAISSFLSLYLTGTEAIVGHIANFLISLLIFGAIFSVLYFFLPQTHVSKKVAVTSGLLTATLFSIGKSLIGMYLGRSAASSAYGAAGSLIVLLLWVYYSSAIIFLSAEIAYEINKDEIQ